MSEIAPQVGDSTNLLLKKLVTATQALAASGGTFLTQAEADALYFRLDGSNGPFVATSATVATVRDAFNLTSAGSIALTAGGTNKNVTITPSGTGAVLLAEATVKTARVTIGATSDAYSTYIYGGNNTNGVAIGTHAGTGQGQIQGYNNTFGAVQGLLLQNAGGALGIGSSSTIVTINGTTNSFTNATGAVLLSGGTYTAKRATIGSNYSLPAWGVTGPQVASGAYTITDSSSSGTVATAVANSFAVPTFAASSATTFTNAANLYIAGDVAAGTNVTLTNSYGLWNAGKSRFDDAVTLPSTNTLGLQLYNTTDQTTNYERLGAFWSGNVAEITSSSGGSGTFRAVRLGISTTSGTSTASRYITFQNSSPLAGITAGTSSSTAITFFNVNGTSTATSGTVIGTSLTPTYNQASGTAANTDLLINRTQTAVGSGAQLLIDGQVGGVSKFSVTNTGVVQIGGGATNIQGTGTTMTFEGRTSSAAETVHTFSDFNAITGASVAQGGMKLGYTINQTGTSSFTDLLVNRTQTAAGSGTQRLLDLQVGGVSKFSVSNTGVFACSNTVAAAVAVASTHKVTVVIGGVTYYLLASNV